MKERPILFSGPMVRAILEGRKTQTRRVVKPQPTEIKTRVIDGRTAEVIWVDPVHLENRGGGTRDGGRDILQSMVYERCRYGRPGDRLWVRETWLRTFNRDLEPAQVVYRADGWEYTEQAFRKNGWSSPYHMPRAFSRLTLEVVSVRVERLQAITEADALAEGATPGELYLAGDKWQMNARDSFVALWMEINGKRAPWASNPWVWVVEFKRVTP